jgi:putative endopeptidase
MKKQLVCFAIIAVTALSACKGEKDTVLHGINVANLDTAAIAGNDFYQFADGGWLTSHPLKPEYPYYGTFDVLGEQVELQEKELITEIAGKTNAPGSIAQKIGDLYALKMDSVRLNKEGNAPLLPYLEKIKIIKDKSEITSVMATLFHNGLEPFFSQGIGPDYVNSSLNIYHLAQGGYAMGERDYYLENAPNILNIRAKYVEMIEKLFVLSNYSAEESKKASTAIMQIETQLAKAASSNETRRNPQANYHKISVDELIQRAPAIDWTAFFPAIGIKNIKELNLAQLEPISEVSKILQVFPLEDIKYYLTWNMINAFSSTLNDEFSTVSFEFYGKTLSGTEQQRERWKRAISVIDNNLGEAMGQLYVEKYFPPENKAKILDLVHNLQTALSERIANLPWMSDITKTKAQGKLAAFRIKIGYPDKWRDYSNLTIDKQDSYLDNGIRIQNFLFDYNIHKFNQPVDKEEWHMTPQTVNAYYSGNTNSINFPAAILQPPFFDINADDAVNYGAIGAVIGHEMTHGFDDQGRQFDKDGNMKDWWTADDAQRFNERAQVLVDYFDQIVVLDTIHANGRLTLGENIADQGGLQVAWQAYQNTLKGKTSDTIAGYTPAQRFFISYANSMATHIRNEFILYLTKADPHSLGKWRVNGALPHIDAWYDAFDVTPENTLYVPKEKRASIW